MKNKLIDADSYLKNFCNRFCSVKECTSTQKKSCCIAISLKDEPAVEVPQWIPCSERLPVNYNNILICQRDGYVNVGYCSLNGFKDVNSYPYKDVVAWMPLPEPYKGE